MNTNQKNAIFRKPATVLVAVVLSLSLSIAVLATASVSSGFFKDLTNWHGAVVGTSYEQATEEIDMNVTVDGNELNILAIFSNPQTAPYVYTEQLGIAAYQIVDTSGNVVKEGATTSAKVTNGQATITIQLDGIETGIYELIVTSFVSEKKADQPLSLNGKWECAFSK